MSNSRLLRLVCVQITLTVVAVTAIPCVPGAAYIGSLNGTTISTARTTCDAHQRPSLALMFPPVDLGGSITWIATPPSQIPSATPHILVAVRNETMPSGGEILAVKYDPQSGELQLPALSRAGYAAVHITADPSGTWLAACDYNSGHCSSFRYNATNGDLSSVPSGVVHFNLSNPGPSPRQSSSHPHQANFAPFGSDSSALVLFVPDLGADMVHRLLLDRSSGELTLDASDSLVLPPGSGPRHMVWSPDRLDAYVVCEISSQVARFRYDPETAMFKSATPAGLVSTLSRDHPGTEFTKAAEVAMTPDGALLFASNRGNQSIAGFQVGADKAMGLQSIVYNVSWPRDILTVGSSLIALEMNRDGKGAVSVYDFDLTSHKYGEMVSPPRQMISVPTPASFALVSL